MAMRFPELDDWHATRRSLHAWSKALSAVRRDRQEPHPRWWHISLAITPRGLSTGPLGTDMAAPAAELDLRRHELTLRSGDRALDSLSLTDPPPVATLAGWLGERLESGHGGAAEIVAALLRDDSPRQYEPADAERYRQAVGAAARVLAQVRDDIDGERGPVQLWAHHFDVAFELFGDRLVAGEEEGERQPAQIGFGFFPGDDDDPRAYFYGTPWPFVDSLLDAPLAAPASWQKEPWEGARLPYSAAVADDALVGEFFRAVHASGRVVLRG
jgi:hypothetical protein